LTTRGAKILRYEMGTICVSMPVASEFWNNLTKSQKAFFVIGYTEGYVSGGNDMLGWMQIHHPQQTPTSKPRVPDSPLEITYSTLIDGIDQCYSDFRNRQLNVEYCFDWTVQGIRGMSDEERESYLVQVRRAISAMNGNQ
jgi:hypothetical protein